MVRMPGSSLRYRVLFIGVLAVLLATRTVRAQVTTITITPPAPTTNDVIHTTANFTWGQYCAHTLSTVVNGNTVRTTDTISLCETVPDFTFPVSLPAQFGPLPAGNYTYEVYYRFANSSTPVLLGQQAFAVASFSPVPTLQPSALAVLALMLAAAGMVFVRRQ
jgi:hypothetical protein